MFFYISLFVASIIAAFVALYLFNLLVSAGRAVQKSMLPSSKGNVTRHVGGVRYGTAADTSTPWGWKGHSTPAGEARTHPAKPAPAAKTPWGWQNGQGSARGSKRTTSAATGLDAFMKNGAKQKSVSGGNPNVGWPYREEKKEVAGRAYKVTRKNTTRSSNVKSVKAPWGW
jgi:hypothetical protein